MIHNMFEDFFVIKWYQYKYFKHRRQISTLNWDTDYWKINTFFIFFFTEISCQDCRESSQRAGEGPGPGDIHQGEALFLGQEHVWFLVWPLSPGRDNGKEKLQCDKNS